MLHLGPFLHLLFLPLQVDEALDRRHAVELMGNQAYREFNSPQTQGCPLIALPSQVGQERCVEAASQVSVCIINKVV